MIEKEYNEEEIDIKEVYKTIVRNKIILFISIVVLTISSVIFAYFSQNIYQASTSIEISQDDKSSNMQDNIMMQAIGFNSSVSLQTEIEIIKSRFMIEKAIKDVNFTTRYFTTKNLKKLELYKDSPFIANIKGGEDLEFTLNILDDKKFELEVEYIGKKDINISYAKICKWNEKVITKDFSFVAKKVKNAIFNSNKYKVTKTSTRDVIDEIQKNLDVNLSDKNSNIIIVKFNDNVPLRAKEFANSLAKAYLDQNVDRKTIEASKTLEFINGQLIEISKNLKDSELKIENFKKSTDLIDVSLEAQSAVDKLGAFDSKLAEITIEEDAINMIYESVRNKTNLLFDSSMVNFNDPSLMKLVGSYQDLYIKRSQLLVEFTNAHPDVIEVNNQLNILSNMIMSSIRNIKKSIENRKQSINKIVKKYNNVLIELPTNERKLADLKRKFIVNEKIYSFLLEKRAEASISKAGTVSRNRVLDSALKPIEPIKPKKKLIVLVGFILGLIFGVVIVFIKEFIDDRIKSTEEVEKNSNAPLLGIVPHIAEKDFDSIKVFDSPKSMVSEAFRTLRTNLQFMTTSDKSQVIVVSSTVGGEGKTTVSTNLAAIFSVTGKKTVVINLDMRKPTLHKKFDLPNNAGISSVLAKKENIDNVIQHSNYDNLDIITSGPIPPNPSELIQSDEMHNVISKLKEEYDIVIFDTPPVGLVTDAMNIMKEADVSIYVVRTMYSKRAYLDSPNRILKDGNIKSLGILVNDMVSKNSGYGYGYYAEDK